MADLPKTVDDAVNVLMRVFPQNDLIFIKSMKEDNIVALNSSIGQMIRQNLGLKTGNRHLLMSTGKLTAEEASLVIIKRFWTRLQTTNL